MRFFLYLSILLSLSVKASAEVQTNADAETFEANEAQNIAEIGQLIATGVVQAARKEGHAFRDAHHKAHGCLRAEFSVLGGLPTDLAQGLFANSKTYAAIVRFSNGSGASQDDRDGDGRGMAIKVLGVEGPKLLDDEAGATTQDFLMMNYPVFFVRNIEDYVVFQKAVSGGKASMAWWMFKHALNESAIMLAILKKTVTNPLGVRYWSETPSKLGPKQMKFSAEPSPGAHFTDTSSGKDLLRENMLAALARGPAQFDFKIQLRTSPEQPIEDPTVEWDEAAAPFQTVARILIPPQTPMEPAACEELSYTPWHAVVNNRPLGGIARARKQVYLTISKLRHELNEQPRVEP